MAGRMITPHALLGHNSLAQAWVAYWHAPEGSAEREALTWASDRESELIQEDPDGAWFFILEVMRTDSSPAIAEVLSAGPLEDLLAKHGQRVIDRVESEARSNAAFARLLGGVWRNAMTDEVWSRVQQVWDRGGWDGIPEA